jgi:hypothetical protein
MRAYSDPDAGLFGAAWPFSICSLLRHRRQGVVFLIVVLVGYAAGSCKPLYRYDYVIFLYALNGRMLTDIVLYFATACTIREA